MEDAKAKLNYLFSDLNVCLEMQYEASLFVTVASENASTMSSIQRSLNGSIGWRDETLQLSISEAVQQDPNAIFTIFVHDCLRPGKHGVVASVDGRVCVVTSL
mmetsp:Transcript_32722/g.101275  ORF Transcript_32722/g.101275 Transcript_32722/m.101275 type:complete len:103 (-) Transcript_32722:4475-4783(-)